MLLGTLIAAAVAGIPGTVNGLLVSRLRVPPFIGTLGMFGVVIIISVLIGRAQRRFGGGRIDE